MDVVQKGLAAEKAQLLRRLAEIEVEQQRQQGVFRSVPH
jgi:hypothetical protein